ncbi:MAG: hypothetical protein WBP81_29745 [Solirubrobacteraceae bacterium]
MRLPEQIRPHQSERVGFGRQWSDPFESHERDVLGRNPQPGERLERGIRGVGEDVGGYQHRAVVPSVRAADVSDSRQRVERISGSDHRPGVSKHAHLQHSWLRCGLILT